MLMVLITLQDPVNQVDDMPSTGRDDKLYPYVLTITPKYVNKDDIVVKVKAFEDMVLPTANKYPVPAREADYDEGEEQAYHQGRQRGSGSQSRRL